VRYDEASAAGTSSSPPAAQRSGRWPRRIRGGTLLPCCTILFFEAKQRQKKRHDLATIIIGRPPRLCQWHSPTAAWQIARCVGVAATQFGSTARVALGQRRRSFFFQQKKVGRCKLATRAKGWKEMETSQAQRQYERRHFLCTYTCNQAFASAMHMSKPNKNWKRDTEYCSTSTYLLSNCCYC
jgi:hypothetical protein